MGETRYCTGSDPISFHLLRTERIVSPLLHLWLRRDRQTLQTADGDSHAPAYYCGRSTNARRMCGLRTAYRRCVGYRHQRSHPIRYRQRHCLSHEPHHPRRWTRLPKEVSQPCCKGIGREHRLWPRRDTPLQNVSSAV